MQLKFPEPFYVYQAPDGFAQDLVAELTQTLGAVYGVYENLVIAAPTKVPPAWAQNIWLEPVLLPAESINSGAKELKKIGRNWCLHSTAQHRRAQLIQELLSKINFKPVEFLSEPPRAPLGAWTLLEKNSILASTKCSSAYPQGCVNFVENKTIPPSRAYLKLWELFTAHGVRPSPGEICMDLGSCPGGWTWVLQTLGCKVKSVDKAPLAPQIAKLPNIEFIKHDAFTLDPIKIGALDWFFSDIICYPPKLFELVQKWRESGLCKNFVCTIKFQGETDFETTKKFLEIPGSRVIHLSQNKHELTWINVK